MAQIPKGRLVKGAYNPTCRDCAIYFSITVFFVGPTNLKSRVSAGTRIPGKKNIFETPPISGDFVQCCSINVGQKCLVCPSAVKLVKYQLIYIYYIYIISIIFVLCKYVFIWKSKNHSLKTTSFSLEFPKLCYRFPQKVVGR